MGLPAPVESVPKLCDLQIVEAAIIDRWSAVLAGFATAASTNVVGGIVGEAVSVAKLRRTPESVIVNSAQVDQQMSGHRAATLRNAVDNVLDLQVGNIGWTKMAERRDDIPVEGALDLSHRCHT